MPPPVQNPSPTPYRWEAGGGYSSVRLTPESSPFTGPHYQFRVGRNFSVRPRHGFFLNGVFRHSWLSGTQSKGKLSMVHFGLDTGYEVWLAPGIASAFLSVGMGTHVFYSGNIGPAENPTQFHNKASVAFSSGAGLTLGRGVFTFMGAYQPNLGLQTTPDEDLGITKAFNPRAYFFSGGMDLAKVRDLGKDKMPQPDWETFAQGIRAGLILDGSYTHNFGHPDSKRNALRVFDTRNDRPMANLLQTSLGRQADAQHPLGFDMTWDFGENVEASGAEESLGGDYYDLQRAYLEICLSVGKRCLTIRGGKFATLIGHMVIEPTDNSHSKSIDFGLFGPFTHMGGLLSLAASEKVEIAAGLVNGWDNVLGHDSGPTGLFGIGIEPGARVGLNLSGSVGNDSNRLRSAVYGILQLAKNRFALALPLGWGHLSRDQAHWFVASLNPRFDFNEYFGTSGRVEVFHDPQGARTQLSQTVGSAVWTFHILPVPLKSRKYFPLEIRPELRHDFSNAKPFLKESSPASGQTTFGLGLTLNFENLRNFRRSSP